MPDKQLPSLNGLRAVSISLVLASHALFNAPPAWKPYLFMFDGALGVRIFFCISGFLITFLLLREKEQNGSIELSSFYLRRALRIMPVCYAYVGVLFILTMVTSLQMSGCQFATALTFTKNYACGEMVDGHLWSLAVEEQFYLFWPLIVAYCRPSIAMTIAAVLFGISPASRALEYIMGSRTFFWLPSNTDALMSGASLAYLAIYQNRTLQSLVSGRQTALRLFSAIALLLPSLFSSHLMFGKLTVTIGPTLQATAATCLITSLVFQRNGITYEALNTRPAAYIGMLSYSLYIWQEIVFFGFPGSQSVLLSPPINLLAIFLIAMTSYHLLERPLMSLRRQMHPITPDQLARSAA